MDINGPFDAICQGYSGYVCRLGGKSHVIHATRVHRRVEEAKSRTCSRIDCEGGSLG